MRISLVGIALCGTLAGCSPEPEAPFVVPPETRPAELVCATSLGNWADRIAALPGVAPASVVPIPQFEPSGEPGPGATSAWVRDSWLFLRRSAIPAVLLLPGNDAFHAWIADRFPIVPLAARTAAERGWPAQRYDAGGNIIASPPLGRRHPHGRLIIGARLQDEIKGFLARQAVQTGPDGRLIEVDTSALRTGHVDEIIGFVPATDPPGFRLILPDSSAALALLRSTPRDRALFYTEGSREGTGRITAAGTRYVQDDGRDLSEANWRYVRIIGGTGAGQVGRIAKVEKHRLWIDKVWDLRGRHPANSPTQALQAALNGQAESMPIWIEVPDDTSRYLVAEGSQHWLDGAGEPVPALITAGELADDKAIADAAARSEKRIAAVEGLLLRELGIGAGHVLRLPVLQIDDGEGSDTWCLTPNPVNLLNLGGLVVVLKTFGPRTAPPDDSTDVLARAIRTALAPRDLCFLDGWDALHRNNGGPRCGTNVLRR